MEEEACVCEYVYDLTVSFSSFSVHPESTPPDPPALPVSSGRSAESARLIPRLRRRRRQSDAALARDALHLQGQPQLVGEGDRTRTAGRGLTI